MQNIKDLFKKYKNLPKSVKDHLIFKAYPKIDKIFPQIGLKDFSIKSNDIKIDADLIKSTRDDDQLDDLANDYIAYIQNEADSFAGPNKHKLANKFFDLCEHLNYNQFDTEKLDSDVRDADNRIIFRKGEKFVDIFNLLPKKYHILSFSEWLEADYSTIENRTIVFSSKIEDIATMSMRGVSSCMRWTSDNASHLVGSIADPCCAIIYSTNNKKTQYGTKIIARAVVRLVIHNKKPALFLEPIYGGGSDQELYKIYFIAALKSKMKKEMEIHFGDDFGYWGDGYIPTTKITDILIQNSGYGEANSFEENSYLSYSDSSLYYEDYDKLKKHYKDPYA